MNMKAFYALLTISLFLVTGMLPALADDGYETLYFPTGSMTARPFTSMTIM